MDVVEVGIESLRHAEYNPRKITPEEFEQIKKSIQEFGFVQPLVVNKAPERVGIIVGGNQRYEVAKKLGMGTVPVVYVHIPDLTKEKELNVRLNRNQADWDWGILSREFTQEDLFSFGFESQEIDFAFGEATHPEDKVPPLPKEARAEKGQVFSLGVHKLYCGDARDIASFHKFMGEEKATMIFTDPPYNVNYKSRHGNIKNDNLKNHFYQFLSDSISAFKPFVTGDVYICMSSSELHTLFRAFTDCGGHWSTFIIWVKNRFTLGRSNYQRQYEPILYGWFEGSSHFWAGKRNLGDVIKEESLLKTEEGDSFIRLDAVETDIWPFDRPTKSQDHPTMKPVELVEKSIKNSSQIGDIFLDPFAGSGSGSGLIACEKTKRISRLLEIDPAYCDVIIKRYCNFTGASEDDIFRNAVRLEP